MQRKFTDSQIIQNRLKAGFIVAPRTILEWSINSKNASVKNVKILSKREISNFNIAVARRIFANGVIMYV